MSQDHIGWHLWEEWDDRPPKILVPILASHIGRWEMFRGNVDTRVIVHSGEREREKFFEKGLSK